MTDSSITYTKGATVLSGPDAMEFYRAAQLATFLRLYARSGIIPTRGVTITKLLALAHRYTGKTYKRGQAMQAADDVNVFVQTMKSALPVKVED